jgi:deaminated glutathione amidase
MKLRVATCQFPVTGDIPANARHIRRLMLEAGQRGADLVHFSEACLSGYPGADMPSLDGVDWDAHRAALEGIMALAADLGVWVVVGSSHPLGGRHKPHNSLYVIDDAGRLRTRYDKRFCTASDLAHYSPGTAFTVFDVKGVRCGALVCFDYRFPELYRAYYRQGVRLMLHSFHNAHVKQRNIPREGAILTTIVPASVCAHAANNHMWISANNSAARVSLWASFFVQPDGRIVSRLPLHRAGLLLSTVDTEVTYYDAPGPFRERALRGVLHSGTPPKDPRSARRQSL